MTTANDVIGWFLVALVLLSPIPYGSNPPIFWAISGGLIGFATLIYFGRAALGRSQLRFPVAAAGAPALLWGLLCLWLIIQMLPFGRWFGPIAFVTADGSTVLSAQLSLTPGSTWMMLIRMVSYGLAFFLAAQAGVNEGRAKRLLTVIFWGLVLHAAFGLLQLTQLNDTLLGFEKKYYPGVATGTFVNRNSYATLLAMGLALGAAALARIVLSRRERNQRPGEIALSALVIVAGMSVLGFALLASQSRMGIFVGLLGAVAVTLLIIRWLPGRRVVQAGACVVAFGLALVATFVFGQGVLERLVAEGGSSSGRHAIFAQVMAMIATRPWLGFGGGAFELAFPLFYGPPLSPDMVIDKAHSTYLSLASELGLVGALLPVAAVGLILLRLMTAFWTGRSGASVLLAGIGVGLVGATHSLVDFSLEIQANAYLFIIVLGLAMAQASKNDAGR